MVQPTLPPAGRPSPGEPTQELIQAARKGDTQAWSCLDQRYRVALTLFMRGRIPGQARSRFDTDDLLQSAFLSAFRELDSYEYRGEGSFLAWLTRILESRLQNRMRRDTAQARDVMRNERYSTEHAMTAGGSAAPSPSEIFSRAEDQARLLQAVSELDEERREIITQHFFDKRPLAAIAREQGRDVKTVRKRLSEAITALLNELR